MNDQEKDENLEYLIFLKEKQDKTVNSRQYADGRKQQGKIDPMNTYTETVSL